MADRFIDHRALAEHRKLLFLEMTALDPKSRAMVLDSLKMFVLPWEYNDLSPVPWVRKNYTGEVVASVLPEFEEWEIVDMPTGIVIEPPQDISSSLSGMDSGDLARLFFLISVVHNTKTDQPHPTHGENAVAIISQASKYISSSLSLATRLAEWAISAEGGEWRCVPVGEPEKWSWASMGIRSEADSEETAKKAVDEFLAKAQIKELPDGARRGSEEIVLSEGSLHISHALVRGMSDRGASAVEIARNLAGVVGIDNSEDLDVTVRSIADIMTSQRG